MERRDSGGPAAASPQTISHTSKTSPLSSGLPASPPSAASPISANNTSPSIRRRRSKKPRNLNHLCLFGILRIFAVVGPMGFVANIIYFQIYMHQSDLHFDFKNELHPLYEFSKSLGDRFEHYRQELNDISSSSNNNQKRIIAGKGPRSGSNSLVLSGRELLEQLEAQAKDSYAQCGSSVTSAMALTNQLQTNPKNLRSASNTIKQLAPFEWRNVVGKYLQEDNSNENQRLTPQQCRIPQRGSLECDVRTYSIVVTFQGETKFRPLFMNLLSWLTYSAVADILVVMPHADWSFEGQSTMDAKYKKRIQTWHESRGHKVSMIGLPKQLDPDPTSKFSFQSLVQRAMAKISSQAILFVDGSVLWEGNNRGLQTGLELWKQNPHALIASHDHLQHPASLSCPKKTPSTNLDYLWSSFCPESGGIPNDRDALHQQYRNILDLNGVFVHRDMLCLIQQPPLSDNLAQDMWPALDDGSDAHATLVYVRSMVATMLLQISGTPPLLFPARIARPLNETKKYNPNWHYLPPVKEAKAMEKMIVNNTLTQQTALVSILGYFGSGLTAATTADDNANDGVIPYWCASNKHANEIFFTRDIPWMPGNGGGKC